MGPHQNGKLFSHESLSEATDGEKIFANYTFNGLPSKDTQQAFKTQLRKKKFSQKMGKGHELIVHFRGYRDGE